MENNNQSNLLAKVNSSLQKLTDGSRSLPPNTADQNNFPPEINIPQNPNTISPININISNVNSANAFNANAFYSTKSRVVALLLCIFLGIFGIHRFYLGKTLTGVLYLFTSGLFIIGWIWDCVMLIMNNAKDGNGQPLR